MVAHYGRRGTHQKGHLGFCSLNTELLNDSVIHFSFMNLSFLSTAVCLQHFTQGPFGEHSLPNRTEYFILYNTGSIII